MTEDCDDLDADVDERLKFWSEFLNTDEGRVVVGNLDKDEMKHFHADGFVYELRKGEEGRILVKLVGIE
jgi:hypothetical protein